LAFLPPVFRAFFRPPELAVLRAPEDFRAPDFFAPEDRDAAFGAFFLGVLEVLPADRALGVELPPLIPPAAPLPAEVELDPIGVRLAPPDVPPPPRPLVDAPED
jgi:hypothetical protein